MLLHYLDICMKTQKRAAVTGLWSGINTAMSLRWPISVRT